MNAWINELMNEFIYFLKFHKHRMGNLNINKLWFNIYYLVKIWRTNVAEAVLLHMTLFTLGGWQRTTEMDEDENLGEWLFIMKWRPLNQNALMALEKWHQRFVYLLTGG